MGIIAALIIAILLSGVFSARYRQGTSVLPIVVFFLVLFFSGLAGQYWIAPFGPQVWGLSLLPMLLFTIIVAIALVYTDPPKPRKTAAKNNLTEGETAIAVTIGVFTWILLIALFIAAVAGYYFKAY